MTILIFEEANTTLEEIYELKGLFELLRSTTKWEQRVINFMGRRMKEPRLTAWYGTGLYQYSGIKHQPQPMTPLLSKLQKIAEEKAGVSFNSVLLNLYRNGQDSVGWHADNEKELGADPIIASMSFGGTRKFKMKHNRNKEDKLDLFLRDGSLLIMGSGSQLHYRHTVPKSKTYTQPRINITFRKVV